VGWLIYGANGYTGQLVARLAVRRGERPVLAGRSAARVGRLAAELGLEHRIFALDEPAALRRGLDGISVVAHCAGPFLATARQMALACCDVGTHYLDITGEIDVFEQLHGLDGRAAEAGVVLLPGGGFDVVPTDCLAKTVATALPGADTLDLAFLPGTGGPSGGTARTAMAMLRSGGRARINGAITPVPVRWKTLRAGFPSGPRTVSAIPWGDVSSAYYSTGIPNITAYTQAPAGGDLMTSLLRFTPVAAAAGVLAGQVKGPGSSRRARGHAEVWARASHGSRCATATLITPNPYDLTADSVVRAAVRLAAQPAGNDRVAETAAPPGAAGATGANAETPAPRGAAGATGAGAEATGADTAARSAGADTAARIAGAVPGGTHTPATAFGAGYVTELDGVIAGAVVLSG
jgi:short subunit dehydrogenase-like uncharacterized protein